ncbi:hypothetical protein [Candidatus Litorirhabdus singularis]|nr:hypothetical protein [Candidatus Litorirhabdus singularis]
MHNHLAPALPYEVADENSFDATAGENAAALGWLIEMENFDAND